MTTLVNVITEYFGSPLWNALVLLALLYLFLRSDKSVKKVILLCLVIGLILIFNPVSYKLIASYFIDAASFYRFLWPFPYVLVVSLAVVRLAMNVATGRFSIHKQKEAGNQIDKKIVIAVIIILTLIALPVSLTEGNFIQKFRADFPQNKYGLSQDVLDIAYVLQQEKEAGICEEQPNIAYPISVAYEYPSYDASAISVTSRNVYYYGYLNQQLLEKYGSAVTIAKLCTDGEMPSVIAMKAAFLDTELDYLAVPQSDEIAAYLVDCDCTFVSATASLNVFRVNNRNYEKIEASSIEDPKVQQVLTDTGVKVREIEISLSGKDTEKKTIDVRRDSYLILNDLHTILAREDQGIDPEKYDVIDSRFSQMFQTSTGVKSMDAWQNISSVLDAFQVDGILMAGDMVDFASPENYRFFKKGLDKIETPILYARADHDRGLWYQTEQMEADNALDKVTGITKSYTREDMLADQASLAEDEDLLVWDKGDYYIVGWNTSTNGMTADGLAKSKSLFAEGKPVILITHVPIYSGYDQSLYDAATEFDPEGRAKLWGEGCLYDPNEETAEFLDMVLAEDSPVVAVVCGHLHFEHTGMLTEKIPQYVLAPTFVGNVTKLVVTE